MTREKLESLHQLRKEIKNIDTLIKRERDRATNTVSSVSHYQGGSGISDKTGEGAANIADLEERKKKLQRKYQANYAEILVFTQSITDPILRAIIICRCVKDYKWLRVAVEVGGGNSENTVRQRYFQFAKQLQKE